MATCMNPLCGKTNLKKCDTERDHGSGLLFCVGCYCLIHPGWIPPAPLVSEALPEAPPVEFQYDFSLSSSDGFRARIGYGDINISFHAPMGEIKRVLAL